MTHLRRITLVLVASVLALAGCASGGGYGYPDQRYPDQPRYPDQGYPDQGYPSPYGDGILGTVERLDAGYGRILLLVDDPRSGRRLQQEVRYDQRTRLFYQGRESAVEGLERGDVVRIDAAASGRETWARTIEVVRNVREGGFGGGYDGGQADGTDLRGSVAYVDTRARTIRLDADARGYRGGVQVAYDGRTTVEYQGRRYRPEDLERGDLVRVQARQLGRDQWLAERIIVERSVGD
ncbi:DUF5666 domain-containing protein [Luteimonas sp. MC1750]|uniref:DUF5666 domain-containing protein n=1 Tax=Luteimonas sp. MC1750 TaxID=2799326 RepID=UPI0018F09623|nr:DUF5666 domain-containing protein [Luteimonas sp. MC1750]MBJ6984387.1 hypothetical protein [Luteimonas sp. MC1750]QQO04994.1 hypothetical protein JGR68_08885 [Luteimonas sp. MC1750]